MTSGFGFTEDAFRERWPEIEALVRDEWPDVDSTALARTEGDPEAVVGVLASATDHTRTLLRKQLGELADVAGVGGGLEVRLSRFLRRLEAESQAVGAQASQAREQAEEVLGDVRRRGQELADEVRREATERVPDVEERIKSNVWTSLLAALGLGVLLGMLVGGGRGR